MSDRFDDLVGQGRGRGELAVERAQSSRARAGTVADGLLSIRADAGELSHLGLSLGLPLVKGSLYLAGQDRPYPVVLASAGANAPDAFQPLALFVLGVNADGATTAVAGYRFDSDLGR